MHTLDLPILVRTQTAESISNVFPKIRCIDAGSRSCTRASSAGRSVADKTSSSSVDSPHVARVCWTVLAVDRSMVFTVYGEIANPGLCQLKALSLPVGRKGWRMKVVGKVNAVCQEKIKVYEKGIWSGQPTPGGR